MTEEHLMNMVDAWTRRLRLTHWSIRVDFTVPTKNRDWATTLHHHDYDEATVRFRADFGEWPANVAEQVVVHELMHLVMRDLEQHAVGLHRLLEPQTRRLARGHLLHELEGVIDRLATILVEIAPADRA